MEPLEIYREEGKSARSLKCCVELRSAITYVEDRVRRQLPIDVFVVYDLSRFSRDLHDQLEVERRMKAIGLRLVRIPQTARS